MKANSRQTDMLDALGAPSTNPKPPEITTVDYTTKVLGTNLGHRMVIVMCPHCAKHSIYKEGYPHNVWIHCEEIWSDPKGNPRKRRVSHCSDKDNQ